MDLRQLAEDIRYHGSPYSFDIFKEADLTGSGGNYFGAGLYDSSLRNTAMDYAGDTGYIYSTKTPNINEYLDYRKPLSQQSPEIIKILKNNGLYSPNTLGADFYEELVQERVKGGMDKNTARRSVSNELRMYGIKGNTFDTDLGELGKENVRVTYLPEDVTIVSKQSAAQSKQPLKNVAQNVGKNIVKAGIKVVPVVGTVSTLADIASQLTTPVTAGTLNNNYRIQTGSPWEQQQLNNVLNYFGR